MTEKAKSDSELESAVLAFIGDMDTEDIGDMNYSRYLSRFVVGSQKSASIIMNHVVRVICDPNIGFPTDFL